MYASMTLYSMRQCQTCTIILLLSPFCSCSAVNSRPVSPNSEFKHRVPNFDLKAMAHYASSLLSNQQQQQRVEGAEVSKLCALFGICKAIIVCPLPLFSDCFLPHSYRCSNEPCKYPSNRNGCYQWLPSNSIQAYKH